MPAKYFISAVSSEFHSKDPNRPQSFESYRDVMTRSLRRLVPGCEVIVQEELRQGPDDILHTLDLEIRQSTVVVHLIGSLAGAEPQPAELRRLSQRYPDFLSHEPELKKSLNQYHGISYTQWEAYLAFHHSKHRLIFNAHDTSPRSPVFVPDGNQMARQKVHFQRIQLAGEHYQLCYSQSDWAVKTVVSIERHGLNPTQPGFTPDVTEIVKARSEKDQIINQFVANLRQSVNIAITEYDPAGIEAFLKALDPIVQTYGLTRKFLLDMVNEELELRSSLANSEPTPENLYDLAFAEMALGHYHDAIVAVRQSIDQEVLLISSDPENHTKLRDQVLSNHLLWHDAATYAGLRNEAYRALEAGARFIDRNLEPRLWADFHEEIVKHCLESGDIRQAMEIIDEVIDIREEMEDENSLVLARSLLLWCRVLNENAKYHGVPDVADRAEKIFLCTNAPDFGDLLACLDIKFFAFFKISTFALFLQIAF
jgi:hypothetical protein